MKVVVSASRREDMIANKKSYMSLLSFAKDGIYKYDNKYTNTKEEKTINTDDIGAIVLWSKDYTNFLANAGELNKYNLYFNFTITGHSEFLEPNVPHYRESIAQMKILAKKYGPECINWRFDPVCFIKHDDALFTDYNPKDIFGRFKKLCKLIGAIGVTRCTFSFLSLYGPVKQRLLDNDFEIKEVSEKNKIKFASSMASIAKAQGITLYACSDSIASEGTGVLVSSCINGKYLGDLFDINLSKANDAGQRKACGCTKSTDIGNYNTCVHGCVYCYARPL